MGDDEILLSEFKTFLHTKPKKSVIDFDNRFTRKFDLQYKPKTTPEKFIAFKK